MSEEQTQYYQKRAKEYELVYQKPERQKDLHQIKEYLIENFSHQSVIEIACGTGYWTEIIAKNTQQILGVDINKAVIDIAQQKNYRNSTVNFAVKDFHDLASSNQRFDGLFGGFIWSHILKQDLDSFISIVLNLVKAKGQILFIDNKFVPGNSTPISKVDQAGNSFQKRSLSSGEQFEVIKNYPTQKAMIELWEKDTLEIQWIDFEYYWLLDLRKK